MKKDTTDYKQIAYKLQNDIDSNKWLRADEDLKFLKEIKRRLRDGIDKGDPTQVEFAFKMIDDWIDELNKKLMK